MPTGVDSETAPINSLSSRPKPSHGLSTANSLLLLSLRLQPGLSTSHRSRRSHHHSRTHLRT